MTARAALDRAPLDPAPLDRAGGLAGGRAPLGANPWAAAPRAIPGFSPVGTTPPLLDLLGASWAMDAPVSGAAWDGGLAGFALGDGSVAVAQAAWEGAPSVALREGGVAVTPATAPPPPVSRQRVHQGACLAIAAAPQGGFLSGGEDGRLCHVSGDGAVSVLAELAGRWIDLVASGPGILAGAGGRSVVIISQSGVSASGRETIELPAAATALAFDAEGRQLAIAHYRGVTIWSAAAPLRTLESKGFPRAVAWSPDGAWLVCGLQENALHAWRVADGHVADGHVVDSHVADGHVADSHIADGHVADSHVADGRDVAMGATEGQPRSLGFFADGTLLASSGGARVLCWPADPPRPEPAPASCGLPASRMPVCRVACHPGMALVAAGYQNGAVLLCQPGTEEVLFARGSGLLAGGGTQAAATAGITTASITGLAWSRDGGGLAMANQAGAIGVVALPAMLFRKPAAVAAPRVAS